MKNLVLGIALFSSFKAIAKEETKVLLDFHCQSTLNLAVATVDLNKVKRYKEDQGTSKKEFLEWIGKEYKIVFNRTDKILHTHARLEDGISINSMFFHCESRKQETY